MTSAWRGRLRSTLAAAVAIAQVVAWGGVAPAGAAPATGDIVVKRTIAPGERTVLTVRSLGVVEVVIFEAIGGADLQLFQAGQTPRTARVFSNIRELAFPLTSETGVDFYIRVRPLAAGETTVTYETGTVAQAMAALRGGRDLIRNRGTVVVRAGLHQMPVYQLVPGTVIRVELLEGRGTIALLKARDYLAVRNAGGGLAGRCIVASCSRFSSGGRLLELRLDDYDDRYLVAEPEGPVLTFSYHVIATPAALNYISSCQ